MPLGWNSSQHKNGIGSDESYQESQIRTKYKGLTEAVLLRVANRSKDDNGVRRDEDGKINMVFFYSDATNPQTYPKH